MVAGALICFLALSLVLSACGSGSTSSSSGKGSLAKTQELTFIERGDMASLDQLKLRMLSQRTLSKKSIQD
ncbi:hypothetical protein QS257_15145 [Terrilactibacillus sp. S3-3]|nr:hypothetical protein QS257_15145 [Terrilactibacillus sp. S3-3]